MEVPLLILLFSYFAVHMIIGFVKGRKYLKSHHSESARDYLFQSENTTLALAGLALTAIALFVGFGLQNLQRVSSITLFFSIGFASLAMFPLLVRFPRRAYTFAGTVLADVGVLAIGCGFLVFFTSELPSSYGLIFVFCVFIVAFLILSFNYLYKLQKYWSLFD